MFFGSYQHNLDAKGRLLLPSRFRNETGNILYIMKGYDGALSIFKQSDFEKLVNTIENHPFNKKGSRDYIRIQLASVRELELDSLGRILIPKEILNKFHLGKEVMVIGVGDHIEVWNKADYERYENETNAAFEEIAENIEKED